MTDHNLEEEVPKITTKYLRATVREKKIKPSKASLAALNLIAVNYINKFIGKAYELANSENSKILTEDHVKRTNDLFFATN